MNDLTERLERLGLSEYLENFASEGFDTWETLLDITESDLTQLNVKLGHRRKLQRAIAESRGALPDTSLSAVRKGSLIDGYNSDDSAAETKDNSGGRGTPSALNTVGSAVGTKRKYRRHPKPDKNAPERPPSAYVVFSNLVREEVRGQDLSFTAIAKLVGERWQDLSPDLRETCERQAATAKERYYSEMADYKKTPRFTMYQEYLADFKAKHTTSRHDDKRSKVEQETSREIRIPNQRSSRNGSGERHTESGSSECPTLRNLRSRSNSQSLGTGFGGVTEYHATSASTSPATCSVGLKSPGSNYEHVSRSPGSSPSVRGSIHTGIDLPQYAQSGNSPADVRLRESVAITYAPPNQQSRCWTPQSGEAGQSSMGFVNGRRARASPSVPPPLVRADTTHSSYGGDLPGIPYQGALLPPMDIQKAERMLPAPILSTSIKTSPLDARPSLPGSTIPISQGHGSQWPALLRATELARESDFQAEAATKNEERGS